MIQRLLLLAALSIPWQPTLWAGGKKVLLDAGHARIVYLDSGKTALQTQNLSFRKGNTRVAVISAAHVGTLDYYAAICRYLHQHHFDTVLYEDIHSHADLVELKRTCGGDYRLLHDRMPQLQVAQILGLAFQWDAMDFSAPIYRFADLEERTLNEEITSTRSRAADLRAPYRVSGAPNAALKDVDLDPIIVADMFEKLRQSGFTRELFAYSELSVDQRIDPSDDARERHVYSLVRDCTNNATNQTIAILFGALHTHAFEKFLLADGFKVTGKGWLTVFTW
jgi:hypothetical protein